MTERFDGGLAISERFYAALVAPLLAARFPQLIVAAALIGPGSEVLGYDTPQSTDHEWAPRVLLFGTHDDVTQYGKAVQTTLADELPAAFEGWSTHFGAPDVEGIRVAQAHQGGPVNHGVRLVSMREWFVASVGFDPLGEISEADWLAAPQERLLEATAGAVYSDPSGELIRARAAVARYPRDIWKKVMADQWTRIAAREAFVGRCGDIGDERGSRIIAAHLAQDMMLLALAQARRYAPYEKWLGTAFSQLPVAAELGPQLDAALTASTWKARETHLAAAASILAATHNALAITEPLDVAPRPFHARPYTVIGGGRFAAALGAPSSRPTPEVGPHPRS